MKRTLYLFGVSFALIAIMDAALGFLTHLSLGYFAEVGNILLALLCQRAVRLDAKITQAHEASQSGLGATMVASAPLNFSGYNAPASFNDHSSGIGIYNPTTTNFSTASNYPLMESAPSASKHIDAPFLSNSSNPL